jgi:hypothetical protein
VILARRARGGADLARIINVRGTKLSLETLIEARLKETNNWPQPAWVLTAMSEDLWHAFEKLAAKRINFGYVVKLYGRKPPAETEGGDTRPGRT